MIVGSVSQLSDVEASAHGKSVRWAWANPEGGMSWGGGVSRRTPQTTTHHHPVTHKEEDRHPGGGGEGEAWETRATLGVSARLVKPV